jgi:hypothetical protein
MYPKWVVVAKISSASKSALRLRAEPANAAANQRKGALPMRYGRGHF